MNYAFASTSSAHTYGNVASFITEYIKNLFPKNFFKTVHINSSIAYKQFNILQNSNKEFIKKRKPMLIVRPRIEINDQDVFLFNTYLTSRITDNYMDLDFSNLQPFFEDKEKQVYIKYLLNRMKMLFDISIVVETQMTQINIATDFKNRVRQDHPFYIETSLENFIPKELFQMLSKDVSIPVYDNSNSVKPFLDYVNGKSLYPITYKIKNSSGNDEFFRFYPSIIDTTITGLSLDDGNKKGFVFDAFTINFTVVTEFNSSGLYYYFTENNDVIDQIDISIMNTRDTIIPIFTVNNLFDVQLPSGWNLYTTSFFSVSTDSEPDKLNFKSLVNDSIIKTIKYHKDNGIPLDTFIRVVVLKDNTPLVSNETNKEYEVDFDNLVLTTNKVNMASTYRIIIYLNTYYVNELLKNIYNFNEEK